ncbi:high-affinity iron transporter [Quadrisphaera granulorum]|uniref:High-affinity iron transporter n=1 Tax=Quadrisphaera granulorum TaxID=317664 RepID=A0A316A7S4_9ACTN|nr:FTR1 family protein [Quadrisphaera granulorum]PWJ53765.1 high-affinity iron transporter [Quadrisphaera granulorum]SZE96522.1 high-affinity iron transporter [Quadrisphaera granulorum]
MHWSTAVPNLVIGLREGLEAGLVLTILLAAARTSAPDGSRRPTAPVWLGALAALACAGAFAAVLSVSDSVLSSTGQEALGGLLSVLAVGLITAMVVWMRRASASLAGELRGKVAVASLAGPAALAAAAFLAVGREGLETSLFLWTAARAAGSSTGPLVGAAIGLAGAAVLCFLLFRRAIRWKVGPFLNRTAVLLVVIAAGVLAYGLGDLQDAGWIPGHTWTAFDLTSSVDASTWWVALVTGLTDLSPRMTVLQVTAWAVYLVLTLRALAVAGRAPTPQPEPAPASAAVAPGTAEGAGRRRRGDALAARLASRPWRTAGVVVAVPALAAVALVQLLPRSSAVATTLTVTDTQCAPGFSTASAGTQVFQVTNSSSRIVEVNLDDASGGIVGEIETLAPGTTAPMSATLGSGTYTVKCLPAGSDALSSGSVQVTGSAGSTVDTAALAVKPVSLDDLKGPDAAYQTYAAGQLTQLAAQVATLQADLHRGDLAAARRDWLPPQLTWERVGASYDSFGDLGAAVDALPDGLPQGVDDPGFTGLRRLEFGLWHGQSAEELLPVADQLAKDVAAAQAHLGDDDLAGDPTQLPVRAHEILEDALRDHLTGLDDNGAGARYAMTAADVDVTRTVLSELAPLLDARRPHLVATADAQLDRLDTALAATRTADGTWTAPADVPHAQQQAVRASIGAVLETLSAVPDLLEVSPGS